MNKPDILPMLPGSPAPGGQAVSAPSALVQRSAPVNAAASRAAILATRPTAQQIVAAYVDPYLFETGYYVSQAEQVELTRTAAARIQLRAEAENARPKRRS